MRRYPPQETEKNQHQQHREENTLALTCVWIARAITLCLMRGGGPRSLSLSFLTRNHIHFQRVLARARGSLASSLNPLRGTAPRASLAVSQRPPGRKDPLREQQPAHRREKSARDRSPRARALRANLICTCKRESNREKEMKIPLSLYRTRSTGKKMRFYQNHLRH